MSIIFNKIKYSNFMATGSAPNEVILNKSPTTLISAKNGSGKSIILDAIVFALFGKPHRSISKNQLINSVNGKKCLVEIWFNINTDEYTIRRGIKPNIFEIFLNGILIDQEAATRDYQKFLEQHILKTNIRAFTQSAILGSASFIPFMQMKPYDRREVIEDILDIKIFGVMHTVLKEEILKTKSALSRLDNSLAVNKAKVIAQKNLISKLNAINDQAEIAIRGKIEILENIIAECISSINSNNAQIALLKVDQIGMEDIAERMRELRNEISSKNHSLISHNKTIQFLTDNLECPSCKQGIEDKHKIILLDDIVDENDALNASVNILEKALESECNKYDSMLMIDEKIQKLHDTIRDLNKTITISTRDIQLLEDEISSMASSDILNEKLKLKDMANAVVESINEKTKLSDERSLQDKSYEILKDTGVKTTIIKEYLPIINKLINKYLSIMDFYVDFSLDESFSEVVRSRCRDEFSYFSFSEGEKKRIDVAILFTWRQIAKLKNSINCNILFLDEILDGALDESGIDAVFQIIEEESKHSNIFVISHNDQLKEKFDNLISIKKVGDFSVIDN